MVCVCGVHLVTSTLSPSLPLPLPLSLPPSLPPSLSASAGVGRTGTLISIQAMMKMIEEEGRVDVFNFILGMRRQRSYMVQTEVHRSRDHHMRSHDYHMTQRQYIFIHDAMLEVIRMGNTEVSIQNLRQTFKKLQAQNPDTETSRLEEEYLVSSHPSPNSPLTHRALVKLTNCVCVFVCVEAEWSVGSGRNDVHVCHELPEPVKEQRS